MKKNLWLLPLLSAAAVVLEALPCGAVLRFASPEETVVRTYSCFSLVPFGYANFGPFLTAMCSCILLICTVVFAVRKGPKLRRTVVYLSAAAVVLSLTPLLYGVAYYPFVAGLISVLLAGVMLLAVRLGKT